MNYQATKKTAINLKKIAGKMLTKLRDVQAGETVSVISITGDIATIDLSEDPTASSMGFKTGYVKILDFTQYTALSRKPANFNPELGAADQPTPIFMSPPIYLTPAPQDNVVTTPPVRAVQTTPTIVPTGTTIFTNATIKNTTKQTLLEPTIKANNSITDVREASSNIDHMIKHYSSGGTGQPTFYPTGGIKVSIAPVAAPTKGSATMLDKARAASPLLKLAVAVIVVIVLIRIFK